MKKTNKGTFIISLISAAIAFVIAFAVICPNITILKRAAIGNPVMTVNPTNMQQVTEGSFLLDGTLLLPEDGKKNYLVLEFGTSGKRIQSAETTFSEDLPENFKVLVQRTVDGTYTDFDAFEVYPTINENKICFNVSANNYRGLRVWFFGNCKIDKMSFYNTALTEKEYKLEHEAWRYMLVVAIAVATFVVMFFLNSKFGLWGKITKYIKTNFLKFTTTVIAFGMAVFLGIIAELLYRTVFGADSNGYMFNTASCAAFCAAFVLIAIFIIQRKNFGVHPERAVTLMILTLGFMTIIAQPFAHVCWDNDSHYPWALQNSFFGKAYYTESDISIDIPAQEFQYDASNNNEHLIEKYNQNGTAYVRSGSITFSAPHIPSAVSIAVSRMFGADFHTRYLFGQAMNVICYATLCYFAIKRLKSGKIIMSIVAMFPTNIFIASNYSYDWWVTGFALLGTAYFISEMQQPEKSISIGETIIMCGAFTLMAMPKQLYVIMFALPLFLYKKKRTRKETINYYVVMFLFFAITLIMFAVRSASSLGGSGDIRGGETVNPGEQLAGILKNPFGYAEILIKFLLKYFSLKKMPNYISLFAYLDLSYWGHMIIALLCFAVLTDKDKSNRFKGSATVKILSALVLIGGVALAATSMYLSFTPVGNAEINGCQERYIMPLLAPVLLTVANPGYAFKNKKVYNTVILLLVSFASIMSIVDAVISVMQ
ncbi:MAG: DUF2142 domain-containing protein [Clostridia bacterium]|nr:DUF2142 domain-containing protein [Clostridia bacterium]